MSQPAQIDRFRIIRQIGAGGMGTVYEALDPEIERRVAIKVLRHELLEKNPELLQRLFIEARAANAIGHPGVVQISEAKRLADGTGFLVMELLHGQTLTQLVRQAGGRLRVEVAVQLAIQIASTLRAGHQQGVVHRDLKPENIMLVPDDAVQGGERVKLLDFGIAKMSHPSLNAESAEPLTLADTGLGTPGYMAPEQIRDAAAASPRSDVYGLGAVLFEALSGRRPHVAANPVDLMVLVLSTDAPLLSELLPELPASLCELLAQMLRRQQPAARPDMVEVLRRLYLIGVELAAQRRSGPASADASPAVTASPSAQTPRTLLAERMLDSAASPKSVPPTTTPTPLPEAAASSAISSSTPSQLHGQQVKKPSGWRVGVLSSFGVVVLLLLLFRSHSTQLPPEPRGPSIGSTLSPIPAETPPPTQSISSAQPPVEPAPIKKSADVKELTVPGPVKSHPGAVSHPGCEARPPRTISVNDAAVASAVLAAIKTYHLRLCKGERLVLRTNNGDGSLTVKELSPGVRSRAAFDAERFVLRIQGTLPMSKLLSEKLITISY